MPLPYKPWQALRSKGLVLTIRADVGRDALIPPGLPLAQKPRADMESAPTTGGEHRGQPGNYGLATPQTPVGDDACIVPRAPAPPQGSAGGINPAPTNKFRVSGQTGTAAPHRADVGRDALIPPGLPLAQKPRADMESAALRPAANAPPLQSQGNYGRQPGTPRRPPVGADAMHRPGDPASPQGSAGGINPAPTNKFCVSDQTGTPAAIPNSSFFPFSIPHS